MKTNGDTVPHVDMRAPSRVENDDSAAYVIAPGRLSFKRKGKKMTEDGTLIFALSKADDGWRIASFTWRVMCGRYGRDIPWLVLHGGLESRNVTPLLGPESIDGFSVEWAV